jgi:hypothetical protein
MKDFECTKDGYIGSWDSITERIHDVQDCGCYVCMDWLERECPQVFLDHANQTDLEDYE